MKTPVIELRDLLSCYPSDKFVGMTAKLMQLQPAQKLTTADIVKFALLHWLQSIWITDTSNLLRTSLITALHEDLCQFAERFDTRMQNNGPTDMPVCMLLIADDRYATVLLPGKNYPFCDLRTGTYHAQLPHPPLKTVACDLNVLMLRVYATLGSDAANRSTDAKHTDESSRSLDKPG